MQFGGGIHHCLGAHLARLQAEVALTSLLTRLPHLRPAGEPTWAGRTTLRSVSTVPISYRLTHPRSVSACGVLPRAATHSARQNVSVYRHFQSGSRLSR